jgi:hypothetical protein
VKTPLFALLVLFLLVCNVGCKSVPTEKIRAEILAFQTMIDDIGLEEYESTWSGGVSTTYTTTRENGYRIGNFEHRNPVKPLTRFKTRKPIVQPPESPAP